MTDLGICGVCGHHTGVEPCGVCGTLLCELDRPVHVHEPEAIEEQPVTDANDAAPEESETEKSPAEEASDEPTGESADGDEAQGEAVVKTENPPTFESPPAEPVSTEDPERGPVYP